MNDVASLELDGHDLAIELAFALKLATAADAVTLPLMSTSRSV